MPSMEHLYIVTYDICCDRRWRRVFKTMKGYGEWMQLSVFQCRLDKGKQLQLADALSEIIDPGQDHVLIMDLGPSDSIKPKVTSLGKTFESLKREPVIV